MHLLVHTKILIYFVELVRKPLNIYGFLAHNVGVCMYQKCQCKSARDCAWDWV